MKEKLVVRACERDDLKKIAELEAECFSDAWTEQTLEREFARSDFYGLVATVSGEFVGYALATALFENADLERIAVATKSRGLGFGGALLDYLLNDVKRLGVEQVFLEVRVGNGSAIGLYESRGFETTRIRPRYYPDGEDAKEMKKSVKE